MSMTVIQHIPVGSGGQAEIEFTSIPQSYTDLYLVFSSRSEGASSNFAVKFNGSAGDFTARHMYGIGSQVFSFTSSPNFIGVGDSTSQTANTFGSHEVYIPNYTGSQNKSFMSNAVNENNATEAYQTISAQLWSQSAAITSIAIYQMQGNDVGQYSSATLYGIPAGSDGTTAVS